MSRPENPQLGGADVLRAAAACEELLGSALEVDWRVQVPGMDWTVSKTVAHATSACLWYAVDLWSGPSDDAAFDLSVKEEASNASLLLSLRNAARLCAASVEAAPPGTRGFHPSGSPDPSGFAGMACDELLVHTADAARGLGVPFEVESGLAARVLARLFPWHEAGEDPWQTLLWANNRTSLPGRPDQNDWTWFAAPLSEWDGKPRP